MRIICEKSRDLTWKKKTTSAFGLFHNSFLYNIRNHPPFLPLPPQMANSQPLLFFLLSVLFLLHSPIVHGRQISDGIISDTLPSLENGECEQTYGFLPCSTTVMGNLFLLLVYGYLMFLAATFLSSGSELLLEILGPGVVGGLLLTILGALPDAILILGIIYSP